MNERKQKAVILLFLLIDIFFAVSFFSVKAALILPFLISPLAFILFISFFQNPQSFIRQWNSWLVWVIKFLFLGIGAFIFSKTGYFPVLNDLITKGFIHSYVNEIGQIEGILFVIFATVAQIGFIIGILFNLLTLCFPNKFDHRVPDFKISFFKALLLSILFTGIFSIGLLYLGFLFE
ncbi:MAG: hypothetical protein KBC33_02450 [Candidatus Pacebacteria bacterium]|nr:hypothetical protein [Candidatus Paceibacterota bacterium]